MPDLTVLIPSRNEMFLKNTIEDLLANMRGDTEIIAVLDGDWAEPQIEDHPRVSLVYYPQSIGQRAATNRAAAMATSKYVMKVDGHCAFDKGFDVKLMADMQDDWTVVPIMRNLHAFNWVCESVLHLDRSDPERQQHTRYQGLSGPCQKCGKPTVRDVVWISKTNPSSTSYCFDLTLHFQYNNGFKKRPEGKGPLSETMSLQGSCFMMTRQKYFELNIIDESFGSWGHLGSEVAIKTWLSGGRVICNHNTFYSHMFRTAGGDFGFPYALGGREVERAREGVRGLFLNNTWDKQIHPLSWLVEKFWPVDHWTEEDLEVVREAGATFARKRAPSSPVAKKEFVKPTVTVVRKKVDWGVVYYTDNQLPDDILIPCQQQLIACTNGNPIVSVSLKPMDFGKNIVIPMERGYLAMFEQILAGLEELDTDYVYFSEHDCLYHPSHFKFVPAERDVIYYNQNFWKVRLSDGHCLHYDASQTSGLCGYRDVLVEHYRKRVANTQEKFTELGNTREYRNWIRAQGFEPGTHNRAERVDDLRSAIWFSECPNIDIRHDGNLTPSRWRQDEFRSHRSCRNWVEADCVPGWDYEAGKFTELLKELNNGR